MSQQNLQEIWQIEVGGQVYEAAFGELGEWIAEGSLQPEDKVRKNNLRWIEARKVPNLIPFFNAKEQGTGMPVVVNTTDARSGEPESPEAEATVLSSDAVIAVVEDPSPQSDTRSPSRELDPTCCAIHRDIPSLFVCEGCGSGFCKTCPKSYGGSVKICPTCGSMCRSAADLRKEDREIAGRSAAMSEGFGAKDFFKALSHPFRFRTSLFFGALMFAFFSLGQMVTAIGGIYMIVAAIFCAMSANMLTFGVLANTVENFSQGRLDMNFMPSFEDFSLWDDVVHPLFLSIGAYLSAFGPFIVVLVIGFYFVMNSVTSHANSIQSDLEKLPGTHYYDAQRTVKQSEQVKDVLGDISNKQRDRLNSYEQAASGNSNSVNDPEQAQTEQFWAAAQESRKKELEAALGKSPETRSSENEAMVQGFLNLAPPLVVIGGIFFLWGLFYFPAACAVAGYTRSFAATVNPAVGLDTIKRLGGSYVKVLLMGLVLLIAAGFVSGLLGLVFKPFDLPGFGNLPAKAISSFFTFYVSIVFSCILGFALFKAADRLALPR